MVSVEPGPSSMSWMAWESTHEREVVFPDYAPGGTIVEAGEFAAGVDSLSKTLWRRTLELAVRIGR